MSGNTLNRPPRKAILGQLPRITRPDGSPIRVLLVDDEPALTNLVTMALRYEGWVVDATGIGVGSPDAMCPRCPGRGSRSGPGIGG